MYGNDLQVFLGSVYHLDQNHVQSLSFPVVISLDNKGVSALRRASVSGDAGRSAHFKSLNLDWAVKRVKLTIGLVRITSWYPLFNGRHFGLPPRSIHGPGGKIVWIFTEEEHFDSRGLGENIQNFQCAVLIQMGIDFFTQYLHIKFFCPATVGSC